MIGTLSGFTVGITGHRRWEEQAEILTRRGARVLHGPTMSTKLLGDSGETLDATRAALGGPIDMVVFTTGIGIRSWFSALESWGMDDAMRAAIGSARVLVRGPKAASSAKAAGLEVSWSAPNETNAELIAVLRGEGVSGQRIIVQRDGGEPWVARRLAELGAEVVDVPVYTWGDPDDVAPALRLLDAATRGRVDAVTFTSSYAVQNAFRLWGDRTRLCDAFDSRVLAVAVGPVTAATLRRCGVDRVVQPSRWRLGSMIHELTLALEASARQIRFGDECWRWQGSMLIPRLGEPVSLTPGEVRMLDTLISRGPAVVAKSALVDGADDHAAEAAVNRLRAKLGPLGAGLLAVRRRGYACSIELVAP